MNSINNQKISIAGGSQIDKKVELANKKVFENFVKKHVFVAGGEEIDKKIAMANKLVADKFAKSQPIQTVQKNNKSLLQLIKNCLKLKK